MLIIIYYSNFEYNQGDLLSKNKKIPLKKFIFERRILLVSLIKDEFFNTSFKINCIYFLVKLFF